MAEVVNGEVPVAVGEIWADNDWRQKGRTVRITAVSSLHVFAEVVTDRYDVVMPTVGRSVRILRRRMKPTSTGWRKVS